MNKKMASLLICLLMVLNIFVIIGISPGTKGTTIYVDDDYTVEDATHKMTIQAAVDAALPGDTVYVYNGNYPENVWIDKSINLTGEDKNTTTIDGASLADTVTIVSDWVNLTGFTITGGNPQGVSITSFSEYNTVINNIISSNSNCGVQILGYSNYNKIEQNNVLNNTVCGVELNTFSEYNKVTDNNLDQNNQAGISLIDPFGTEPNQYNEIANNTITLSQFGIYLFNSNHHNTILGNFINNSQHGIFLSISNENNTIVGNTILNSTIYNIYLWSSNYNNKIIKNNLLDDQNLAYDDGQNQWNETYPGGGNFWGNYSGGDNRSGPLQNKYGNDGFGDVSMPILGGSNYDSYPLWPNWDALEYYKPSPGPTDVVEYAMGSVKVGVIFVESDGSIDPESENWSQARKNIVLSEIQDAYTWWGGLEANASLTFSVVDIGSRDTGYEPITHPSTDASLWIDEIMISMGFDSGIYLMKVMAFNHWLREQYSTDWAFSIFVVDSFNDTDGSFSNSASAWAVWVAGLIVMTYDNNGWGIGRMNNVTAHETGHMFYATDEYTDPGERGGYFNELEVDNSGKLMDINNLVLSSGSELQIGWRDIDADGTMDILDTEPNTYLEPYSPDPTFDTSPTYTGHAVVVPYPNNNPKGWSRDVTLNTISNVQVRIDNGSWFNATATDGTFDEEKEAFTFTTPALSAGTHFIDTRSVNSVNNSDPTYANDTITIITDSSPPEITQTTSDVPKSGDAYNVTADVVDNLGVDSVRLEYEITSSEGYLEIFNVSMNLFSGDSYWVQPNIWSNATWFNYTIYANDTNNNWNKTLEFSLNFRVHNLDSLFGFTKIQHAIDDADTVNGQTIFVEKGTYYENVVVDKSIYLTGENTNDTIINGGGKNDVIYVFVDLVKISGFTIIDSGSESGPIFDSGIEIVSDHNNISGNRIISNNYGILIGVSNHNIVEGNLISNNQYGVRIGSSSNNSILFNNISTNNNGGIWVDFSDNTTISNNDIWNNNWGLWLSISYENTVYHNNFINNANQAFDNTISGNQWDNGYPSGGNFWSDYSGPDLYSGPNQDIPGNDGIGDINYSIDPDSRDNYPLFGEIGAHLFLYEGWNLISLPFIQSDTDLISILSTISGSYDAAQWYNTTDSQDPWKHHKAGKPFGNDLFTLNESMGFWIRITDSPGVVFEYPGTAPSTNQSIMLYSGWNLLGYPSLTSYNRTNALNDITFGNQIDAVWTFDPETKVWDEIFEGDFFEIGKGYWVHSRVDTIWNVPL